MGKMYQNQGNLPTLPVPELSVTVDWYLNNLKPIIDEESFAKTEKLAREFLDGQGAVLQSKLLEFSKDVSPNSWLMPYSRDIYLNMRNPITLEGNYMLETAPMEFAADFNYIEYVASVAYCAGLLYFEIVKEELEPMMVRDTPLDMLQFKGLFRGSKIPNENKDVFNIFEDIKEVNSFGVFFKNRFYLVELINENGQINSIESIKNALTIIYENNDEPLEVNFNTAAFAGSDLAAKIIGEISKDHNNFKNIELVHRALFNLTLTNDNSKKHSVNYKMYSDTTDIWPYKTWSVTVYPDKVCSFNHEHTYVDGVTNMYMIGQLIEKMKNIEAPFSDCSDIAKTKELKFNFSDDMTAKLLQIKKDFVALTNELDSKKYIRENLPIDRLKENKIGLDSVVQCGYQYAQLKAFGRIGSIHESVSVTQYYEGRTACIRSASEESVAFVNALIEHNKSKQDLVDLLVKANNEHKNKVNKAKNFEDFIRHAAGLNIVFEKFGNEIGVQAKPELLTEKNFEKISTQEFSTSTIGNVPFMDRFAYAPTTEGGLGIGYLNHKTTLICDITYYKYDDEKLKIFISSLDEYFDKIEDLM